MLFSRLLKLRLPSLNPLVYLAQTALTLTENKQLNPNIFTTNYSLPGFCFLQEKSPEMQVNALMTENSTNLLCGEN